jgi:hypothetical protein
MDGKGVCLACETLAASFRTELLRRISRLFIGIYYTQTREISGQPEKGSEGSGHPMMVANHVSPGFPGSLLPYRYLVCVWHYYDIFYSLVLSCYVSQYQGLQNKWRL